MNPTHILEWWFSGRWNEIGWRATTAQSQSDLRRHAERLAAAPDRGSYRIVIKTQGEVTVIDSWGS